MAKKRKKKKSKTGFGTCDSCDQPLGKKGGMENTGLCGPCCTGEAETIEEFSVSW